MRTFDIIVAMDNERGIGKNGFIPWHIPEEQQLFKTITTTGKRIAAFQAHLVVGRKTWQTCLNRRPLPDRRLFVVSNDALKIGPSGLTNVKFYSSFLEVMQQLLKPRSRVYGNIFVIGGAEMYSQALNHIALRYIYVSHINGSFKCDTFFPDCELENPYKVKDHSRFVTVRYTLKRPTEWMDEESQWLG